MRKLKLRATPIVVDNSRGLKLNECWLSKGAIHMSSETLREHIRIKVPRAR